MNSKFNREWDQAILKTEKAIEKTLKSAALDMFSQIVLKTPVDTGRLRGNWQLNMNYPLRAELNIESKSGNDVINTAKTKLASYTLKDNSIWFSNNLPYAATIEDGGLNRRPYGMVKTTVEIFKPVLEKIARVNKV